MAGTDAFTPIVDIGEWLRANSHHLYKSNLVVLREALQNAVDAIRMSNGTANPLIDVAYDSKKRRLTIRDNGIGMSLAEQQGCFWLPYGSRKRELPDKVRMDAGVIGRFGIGAYTSFRVAQTITVLSRPESDVNGPVIGTTAALAKPLEEYPLHERPAITFKVLSSAETARYWPARHLHGTMIMMELVKPLNETEAQTALIEASAYLNEAVVFQGKVLNARPKVLPSLNSRKARRRLITVADYCISDRLREIAFNIAVRRDGTAAVEVVSAVLSTERGLVEVACAGLVELSKRKQKRILLLKHHFQFAEITDSESWVTSVRKGDTNAFSFEFDGILDLPFVDPDIAREGFSESGQTDMSALLICASHAVVEELVQKGGEPLQKCADLFSYLWHRSRKERERILRTYAFQLFDTKERVTLQELKHRKRSDGDLNVVYVTDDADRNAEQMARSLATLGDYSVIKVDAPEYWKGFVQKQVLEASVGARNVAGVTSFHSVLPDEEIGRWRDYRTGFTAALDAVIGSGHQVLLARIEPKSIVVVVKEGSGVVYLNYNNPEVSELPTKNLLGVALEAKIRSWVHGKVKAAELEQALVSEGKLVIVQNLINLHYVDEPETGTYVPEKDHQFLLVKNAGKQYFALRVSSLCSEDLQPYLDSTGNLRKGLSALLTWVGSTFYFTVRDSARAMPTLVLTFNTGITLQNGISDDSVEGRVAIDFRVEMFSGPHLSGSVFFFVLPNWIGELLERERTKRGNVLISMWSHMYTNGGPEALEILKRRV